jgi:hypothetical protein
MSLTVEFYAAEPQELVALFSKLFMTDNAAGEEDHLFAQLESYPKAEFPGRLLIPDDLDSLCAILKKYRPLIPAHFHEISTRELWNDGCGTESLTLLVDQFVRELATFSEDEIQQAAVSWAETFPLTEPFEETLPYKAVMQLWETVLRARMAKTSLIFYLAGVPGFFEYLRYL